MQSLNDAARLATSGYPGGLAALCVRMDWSYETARKELAGAHGFKLGADRLRMISELCIEAAGAHSMAIINAFNAGHGGFLKLEVRDAGSVMGLRTDVAVLVKEAADVLTVATERLADGSISDNDHKAIGKEMHELQEAIQRVQRDLDAAHQAGKLRAVG